jgi:hypothetical protein
LKQRSLMRSLIRRKEVCACVCVYARVCVCVTLQCLRCKVSGVSVEQCHIFSAQTEYSS